MDDFTSETDAPSPDGSGEIIKLKVDDERVRQLARLRRKTALFELVYNVLGQVPPVNNIGHHENSSFPDHWGGMRHAHAIFKGLKRPMNDHDLDGNVYIYVLSPRFTYRHIPDMVCPAKRFDAPANAVFVVYVVFAGKEFERGLIVNWEWVDASPDQPLYPLDYTDRYEQSVWTNG